MSCSFRKDFARHSAWSYYYGLMKVRPLQQAFLGCSCNGVAI
jgi:hypothetical protein